MSELNLQQYIFDQILIRFKKRSDAIKAIASYLGLSIDAVYRRIRGDSYLTPQEILNLVKEYQVPMDKLIQNKQNSVVFDFYQFDTHLGSIDEFLENMTVMINGAKVLTNIRVMTVSNDIPIFYYTLVPNLLKFKLYVWGNTIWNLPLFKAQKFSLDLFPVHIDKVVEHIRREFIRFETIELWSLSLAEDTLNQLSYFIYSGRLADKNVVKLLFDDLNQLIRILESYATLGYKFLHSPDSPAGTFSMYHNEIIHSVNQILLTSKEQRFVFTPFASPNYLVTHDRDLCKYLEKWFGKIIQKSDLLSQSNEKNRRWFFNQLIQKIEFNRQRLSGLLN